MSKFPQLYLARHGATTWSQSGQHTGLTDIPLTEEGEKNAQQLGKRLRSLTIDHIFSSPLSRASRTASLAGFGERMTLEKNLLEWDYGEYEGLTTAHIHQSNPQWSIFRDGCPQGETPDQVAQRCNQLIEKIQLLSGNTLLFAHAHILRMLTTCWLKLSPSQGCIYILNAASLSTLGYDHTLEEPVIRLWNDTSHLGD